MSNIARELWRLENARQWCMDLPKQQEIQWVRPKKFNYDTQEK